MFALNNEICGYINYYFLGWHFAQDVGADFVPLALLAFLWQSLQFTCMA